MLTRTGGFVMRTKTTARFTGIALVLGGLVGVVLPFILPGGLVVEPLERASRAIERVRVLAENATFTHTSSLLGFLGLFLLVFGLFGVRRAVDEGTVKGLLVTLGVFLVAFGGIGLAFGYGLNYVIANTINHGGGATDPRTLLTTAVTVQLAKTGIVTIAGYGYLLGFVCIAVGLYYRFSSALHRRVAVLVVVVSVVALVPMLTGNHFPDLVSNFPRLGNRGWLRSLGSASSPPDYATLPLSLWALILGVAMTRQHPALTAGEEG
jgi:hypothetical protein